MAQLVKTASVLFTLEHLRGTPNAQQSVLKELESNFAALRGLDVDLVVFSEGVEAIGQTMDQAESVDQPGPILQSYLDFAAEQRCTVAGSIKLLENNHVYNSIVYVGPSGVLGAYHKCFLTGGEEACNITPGSQALVVDTPAGRLGGAICFDLNFTDLAEQYARLKPDIITFASMYHGGLMQSYWAYRSRAYFVSALPFLGGGILNPFGEPLATTDCYNQPIAMTTINLDRALVHLDYNRQKFPDIRRKYLDKIDLHIPANVGSALITSRSDTISAMDVVREFELELLDEYMARSHQSNLERRLGKDRALAQ